MSGIDFFKNPKSQIPRIKTQGIKDKRKTIMGDWAFKIIDNA